MPSLCVPSGRPPKPAAPPSSAPDPEALLGELEGRVVGDAPGVVRAVGRDVDALVAAIRAVLEPALRKRGYHVRTTDRGDTLLRWVEAGDGDLVLTDVVMPQMSGPEVAEKLTTVRPEIKILYMSGYPDHPVFSQGGIKRDTAFLQKPFTPNVLVQKVREVLDGVKVA